MADISTNSLTDEEVIRLGELSRDIVLSLTCELNLTEEGLPYPCRTDRLEAVKLMKEFLNIHDYDVWDAIK
tara:strand:- start:772 stop:984 length:213 start_codon:yes stop_codon:yes gene_type:complete